MTWLTENRGKLLGNSIVAEYILISVSSFQCVYRGVQVGLIRSKMSELKKLSTNCI